VGSGLPYSVISNFVPDDVAVPRGDAAEHLAQLPAEPFLLFVGDVGREKGVDALFQAYGQLSSPPPLVLIGRAGADAPATVPPNVTVLHSWPHHAVMEAWRRSHLACAPSIWPDPCPTVVMEAMAAGRPVIGSQIGGMCDLIADGETGYLVPPGDAEALRAAIERSLASPDLVERMGREARRRVVQFQAHTVVPRVEQAYRDVLDGTLGAQHVDTP
jgi:glycosyltransferase involved in cell wall biosynthesis